MKKAISILLALTLSMTILAGCGTSTQEKEEEEKYKEFTWPSYGLALLLPTPKSNIGSIYLDRDDALIIYVAEMSEEDFNEYVLECQDMGFTVDYSRYDDGYYAYNEDGYDLKLSFNEPDDGVLWICLEAPDEPIQYAEFEWPTCDIASLIPRPKSNIGYVKSENEDSFYVYVAETSEDDFKEYVKDCEAVGFTANDYSGYDYYCLTNEIGYELEIIYLGDDVMTIYMTTYFAKDAPEETETASDVPEETGNTTEPETSNSESQSGTENNSVSDTTAVENTSTEEASEPDVLTADNCPEFAEVLSCGDFSNQLYADFYEKYPGKTVEFDGCIVLVEDDKYNGYYDVMICPGNYNDSAFGPQFMFDGADPSAFEEGNTGLNLPSYVKAGANVHVVASLSRYDDTAGLCYLNPKSVTER